MRPGQIVRGGEILVRLTSPDLEYRLSQAEIRASSLRLSLHRSAARELDRENSGILTEQYARALAEIQSVRAELSRLDVRAPGNGVVRDIPRDLTPGRWVNPSLLLGRVVSRDAGFVEAYVDEKSINRIRKGQHLRFYSDHPGLAELDAIVEEVSPTGGKDIEHPALASIYGGNLAAVRDQRHRIIAHDSVYLVRARIKGAAPESMTPGMSSIDSGLHLDLGSSIDRAVSVLLRETAF